MAEDRDVEAVCRESRIALLDDGTPLEITNFFDEDGDECDEDAAVSCVATDGKNWWAIDLGHFESAMAH